MLHSPEGDTPVWLVGWFIVWLACCWLPKKTSINKYLLKYSLYLLSKLITKYQYYTHYTFFRIIMITVSCSGVMFNDMCRHLGCVHSFQAKTWRHELLETDNVEVNTDCIVRLNICLNKISIFVYWFWLTFWYIEFIGYISPCLCHWFSRKAGARCLPSGVLMFPESVCKTYNLVLCLSRWHGASVTSAAGV